MTDPTTPKLPPGLQHRSDIAMVQEAEAKARSALADASNAEQTATLNRIKGAIGEPTAGPFTGDVTLADGAALAEANFIARAEHTKVAAATFEKILAAIGDRKVAYLTASEGPPDLSHDAALSSKIGLVKNTAAQAKKLSDDALGTAVETREMITAPLAAAGLALSGVSSLLGYFKTDFKVGGNTVTLSDRDLMLLIANALQAKSVKVLTDGFPPTPGKTDISAVQEQLLDLSTDVTLLRGRIAAHDGQLAALDQAVAAAPIGTGAAKDGQPDDQVEDSEPKADTALERTAHEQAKEACTAAVTTFDALISSLDADVGGISFLERALRERRVRKLLGEKAAIVSLKIDGSWATHVVRKNFLSGLFGRLPVQVSATVGASWAAYDFEDGRLLGGGIETSRSELTDIADVKTS